MSDVVNVKYIMTPSGTSAPSSPIVIDGITYTCDEYVVRAYFNENYSFSDDYTVLFSGWNNAGGDNGGVYGTDPSLIGKTVKNAIFYLNQAGLGGAFFIGGALAVEKSSFISNTANTGDGGAIYVGGSGDVTITGSTFTGNTTVSGSGGAIFASGKVTISDNVIFSGNNTESGHGGAIYTSGKVIISNNVVFSGNTACSSSATPYGGALCIYGTGVLSVTGGTFTGNTASYGGAIMNWSSAEDGLSIKDSIFIGNAGNNGGAVFGAGSSYTSIEDSKFLTLTDSIKAGASLSFAGSNTINANVLGGDLTTTDVAVLADGVSFTFQDYSYFTQEELAEYTFGDIVVDCSLAGAAALTFKSGNKTTFNGAVSFADDAVLTISDDATVGFNAAWTIASGKSVTFTVENADSRTNALFNFGSGSFSNNGTLTINGFESGQAYAFSNKLMSGVKADANDLTFLNDSGVYYAGYGFVNSDYADSTAIVNNGAHSATILRGEVSSSYMGIASSAVNSALAAYGTVVAQNITDNSHIEIAAGKTLRFDKAQIEKADNTTGGLFYNLGSLIVTNSELSNNTGTYGGVIINGASAEFFDSDFNNNVGADGGVLRGGGSSCTTFTDCTFTGNTATSMNAASCEGGGALSSHTELHVYSGDFSKNVANGFGGAVYSGAVNQATTVTVTDTAFTGNTAARGGAVFNDSLSNCTITGGIFTGNYGISYAGAVYNAANASAYITNASFSGNTSDNKSSGAVYNAGTMTIDGGNFLTSTDTVYSEGTLTLKGDITTAAAFTVSGTVNAENDAAITLDYSADNKAGYISNLAAITGSYSLSALLAEGVTSGVYTLAGGAADYADTITVKNSTVDLASLKAGETAASNGIIYSLAVNDSAELVLTVTDKLVLSGDISDEKGNYTNTTGASVEVNGAEISNNLYASVEGSATLTVTSGEIKNIFAGAKFENGGETEDITATVGGATTTRVYCGNAVLGGTVTTKNTTLTISGSLAYQDQNNGVWCYGAGIANAGLLKIADDKGGGTSTVNVTASGSVGSIVGGGRAQNSGSLEVDNTYVTIGSNAIVTNAIGGAYNNGTGSVSVGTATTEVATQNVTTVFGGNFITASSSGNTISNVNLTLNGAKASNAVFGGNYMKAGSASIGTVTLDINGGSATYGIYGGGFIVGAATETISDVNITVGGTVIGNIFAGACVSGKDGSSTVEKATITISGNVTGNIYAGGYSVAGAAAVKECTITFSGNGSSFNYNGKVCATSAGKPFDGNNPAATVVFSSYDGEFGGAFAGTFDVIQFTADSSVDFTRTDFDGLKTEKVMITGISDYSATTAAHTIFTLGKNQSYDVNDITLRDADNKQYTLSEVDFNNIGTYAYFWDNVNNVFGYAGAEAIKTAGKSDYKFYQLTAIA